MGFFTWTLANRKTKFTRHGTYTKDSVLQYDRYGAIVCPDNTIIEEPCYQGYGIFDGHDVYELAAEWNKKEIPNIPKIPGFIIPHAYTPEHYEIALAFAADDMEKLQQYVDKLSKNEPYLKNGWKRSIGIFIACTNNHLIPYPIKIVNIKNPQPYDKLRPSIITQ